MDCFSPVAGIQWVETQAALDPAKFIEQGFSPVAGIQWVETRGESGNDRALVRFSPVAGIQWVETFDRGMCF